MSIDASGADSSPPGAASLAPSSSAGRPGEGSCSLIVFPRNQEPTWQPDVEPLTHVEAQHAIVGRSISWSARSGRTAVPIEKNSVVCPPQR